MTYWKHVHHLDERARALADRHYSRQTIGAREFCPPGNKIVLLGLNDDALWVSHRPDPNADLEKRRMDGFDYWDNPYFRNESRERAGELIFQAMAITMFLWGYQQLPPDGFHTFIDPHKVKPIKEHGKAVYGWVYRLEQSGLPFKEYPDKTKARGFIRLVLASDALRMIVPMKPVYEQRRLFA